MPELPEVEMVVRGLAALVTGRRIEAAELVRARLAPHHTADEFAGLLAGARILAVTRRGKHILFALDNSQTLVVHLRMSGRFLLLEVGDVDPKFAHAVFYLDDGTRLVFQDQRHFGMMKIVSTAEIHFAPEIAKLAPEPFSHDFSPALLQAALRASRRTMKEFLLDQTKVTGLGNIYAAEALFLAGIHPAKLAARLSRKRTERLFEMIRFVLQEAIDAGSTLNADPRSTGIGYYGGNYETYWRVYDREGMPCSVCATAIVRLKQAGRSSYFCPRCQRK